MGFSSTDFEIDEQLKLKLHIFRADDNSLSEATDSAAARPVDGLVVLLHGWGADGADLAPLAPMLARTDDNGKNDNIMVVVPDAPEICSANPMGRQWFELSSPDLASERIAEACAGAMPIIHKLLDRLGSAYNISTERIILGGFSQGGMLSLSAGLDYDQPVAGLFCLSGGWLSAHIGPRQKPPLPIFLAHGAQDPVVPPSFMQQTTQALKAQGFEPETLLRPQMAHNIDEAVIASLSAFISRLLSGQPDNKI